jgi:asparagine synthase (glutamine-hydrolysing)
MSGICGIVQDDASARVDGATFDAMARAMASRGPDGSSAWTGGRVALAHAMLRTTFEAAAESQPLTLDQHTWLAADARIDAREQLRAELSAAGLPCPVGATDPELILRAYRAWGEDCVHHLLGDFAFAIWDAPRQTLFWPATISA